jgi:hypothetical protein
VSPNLAALHCARRGVGQSIASGEFTPLSALP